MLKGLIIDDEPDIAELIKMALKDTVSCDTAHSLHEAKEKLKSTEYQLCLTDLRLPDGLGTELIPLVVGKMPIAVLTAHGSTRAAVDALKAGAFDFLSKPINFDELRSIVKNALKPIQHNRPSLITGDSPAILELKEMVNKVAATDAPVYIYGPSGSGKERVAREIHAHSGRANGPFVPLNCGAISPELMESELFGHKKGSFTGAHQSEIGVFRAADHGTLFLDEIAELPLNLQVKLLRAIQERAVRPVGQPDEIKIDVRIISATHQDLAERIDKGQFREDLYYRLNVIPLIVPPLKARLEDIPQLTDDLSQEIARRQGRASPELTPAAIEKLMTYDYPGNVRELENILERALALSPKRINDSDIQLPVETLKKGVVKEGDLEDHLADVERTAIVHALAATDDLKSAADTLGVTLRSLRYRIKKLGIHEKR